MSESLSLRKKFHKPSILIIDDEEKICDIMENFLTKTDLFGNVVIAKTASEGSLKIHNEFFDLVIVDFKLPGRSGLQLVESLQKIPKNSHMKFLLISGFLDQKTMIDAIAIGIKHVMVKPFKKEDLLYKIIKILRLKI